MKNGKTQFVAIILVAVIAFVFGLGGGLAADYLKDEGIIEWGNSNKSATADGSTNKIDASGKDINIEVSEDSTIAEAVAAKVMPSVVGISTTYTVQQSNGYGFLFGYGYNSYDASGVGTGVIVDDAGYILTNAHVVNDGDYKSITVSLYDGTTAEGTVLWQDSTLDLAVVKVETDSDLKAAKLGDSSEVQVGAYAAAIGNPLGLAFERSMSQGIISGLNRSITVSNESTGSTTTMEGLMQTDATINSGNSGGPLLNSKGEVIGINSAKAGSGEGMGFAIPINVAKPIVDQIIETGSFNRPYIGITGIGLGEQKSYTDDQLEEYFHTTTGVYVNSISEGGGAEAAGIKQGDIILSVDGTDVNTMNKINSLLVAYKAGDTVSLEIMRDGETTDIDVTLTDGNSIKAQAPKAPTKDGN